VQDLLELSRRARWAFPTSSGPPVPPDSNEPWLEQLLAARAGLAEAALALPDDDAAELAANAWRIWMVTRELQDGRAFMAAALDGRAGGSPRFRSLALYGDGLLAFWSGAYDESRERNEAALAAAREADDPEALALAHLGLCRSEFGAENYEEAHSHAEEALAHADGLRPAMSQAVLHGLGQSARFLGNLDEAAALLERSLALNRELDDRGMVAVELHNLGHVELHRGNVDAARRRFEELDALAPPEDDFSRVFGGMNAAALALAEGEQERAASLLGDVDTLIAETGLELPPDDQFELNRLRGRLAERSRAEPRSEPRRGER
jgi:tetratricopeptide (TPR) repeat protein